MTEIEEQQFLTDVITAAGLVSHGKQSKVLGERISKYAHKRMVEITEKARMSSIWVLTEEYNDYDQFGEYFVHAWNHKPSKVELSLQGVEKSRNFAKDYLEYVLNGGGQIDEGNYYENQWYILKEIKNDIP